MLYHASQTGNIKLLEPRTSNHNTPLIYFSAKRENALVYLSNAIEKYCKETNFVHNGKWHKWASYGFEPDGILRLDEYYPNAIKDTYQGVSGYIYCVNDICKIESSININNVVASSEAVPVIGVEFIENAYAVILKAEESGLIKIRRFEEMNNKTLEWIESTIKSEYLNAGAEPDYRYFLKAKFPFLSSDC